MDNTDKKLLSALVENARTSLKNLSAQVSLSSPAVSSRMERLEQTGVITGYHAAVSYEKLGYHIVAFVNLAMPPQCRTDCSAFVQRCPNVVECYQVAGPHSMLMKVCFAGTQQLNQFVEKLQEFGTTQTQIVFSTLIAPRAAL